MPFFNERDTSGQGENRFSRQLAGLRDWWPRKESNLHGAKHRQILSLLRLPVPPLGHIKRIS
jgi:hypothetical protein